MEDNISTDGSAENNEGAMKSDFQKSVPRVLIADDESDLRMAFEFLLERAGYKVDTVEDGYGAVKLFREKSYDVVLTDLTMPGMDGIQLLRSIREIDLDVPVIIVTATPSLETAIRAVEYGALRYLQKPVANSQFLKVVEEAVRLHKLARIKRQALAIASDSSRHLGDQAGLEVAFEKAMDNLFVLFQPILKWSEKRVFGYEALLRSSEKTLPNPGALFDAAERLGRLPELGRAVRTMVPGLFHDSKDNNNVLLFLNLHTADLDDNELYSVNSSVALLADRTILEITERDSLESVSDVRSRIKKLREMGYRIAVDDLGAGYAGLTSFSMLEPEVVKLDMSLIRDVHLLPTKKKLIKSMVELCRDMNIELISEGIEKVEERDTLVEIGCDLFQGFLFAKPGKPFPSVLW